MRRLLVVLLVLGFGVAFGQPKKRSLLIGGDTTTKAPLGYYGLAVKNNAAYLVGSTGPAIELMAYGSVGQIEQSNVRNLNDSLGSRLKSSVAAATYAPMAGATFTGIVSLPATTSIGSVSATDISRISGLIDNVQTQFSAKVDKISGKGLSTNDYTNDEKAKLEGFASGQVFKSEWNASTNTPTLTTTASTNGDYYLVSVAGTQSITGSSISFSIGDRVVSNGTAWKRVPNSTIVLDGSLSKAKLDTILNKSIRQSEDAKYKYNSKFGYPNDIISDANASLFLNGFFQSNGTVNTTFSDCSYQSNYVSVEPNTDYKYTGQIVDNRYIIYYDINKNFISSTKPGTIGTYTTHTFTTPSNCYFIRSSCMNAAISTFKIEYVGAAKMDLFAKKSIETSVLYADKTLKEVIVNQNDLIEDANTATFLAGGYYNSNGTIGTVGGTFYSTQVDYIPVFSSADYKYTGEIIDNRYIIYYDINKNYIGSTKPGTIGTYTTHTFTTPSNCRFIRCSITTSKIPTFKIEYVGTAKIKSYADISYEKKVDDILTGGSTDYTITYPDVIYGVDNNSSSFYGREYISYLYPESFVQTLIPIKVNGSREFPIQSNNKNTNTKETFSINWSVGGSGYATKTGILSYIKTKSSNAKSKVIRMLTIGDSITQIDNAYDDGTKKGGWSFPSIVAEMALMDNKDHADNQIKILSVGTGCNRSRDFVYNGETLNVRSFAEGRPSWAAATYLRHAWLLTGSTGASSSYAANGAASWAALGLLTTQGVAYNKSTTHRELIATTVMGKNPWSYDSNLWDWLKAIGGAGWTGGTGSYTGSGADNTAIDVAMNYILDNPFNVFYDKVKAQTSGTTNAFSLTKYLARYKTLSDSDGTTRLVVGSTAGTVVTNATSWDVCTPTHIVIELGENDRSHFSPTATRIKNDLIEMSNTILAENSSIHVGIMNNRSVGVINQADWADVSFSRPFSTVNNLAKFELQEALKAELGNISTQTSSKKWLIPTYYTMSPVGGVGRKAVSLTNLSDLRVTDSDTVHPGIIGHWGMADQVYGWLLYTL